MLLTKNKTLRQLYGFFETFNPLMLKLLWKNPSKFRAFPGEVFRAYMSVVEKDKWVCKDIFDYLADTGKSCKIMVEHLPGADRSLPLRELAVLALITKVAEPKKIFEIGTYGGRTALNFAQNSLDDCIVWTLDTSSAGGAHTDAPDGGITGRDYKGKEDARKIRQLYGDWLTFDFSPYFGKMDIAFINGIHAYQAAKSDTMNALKMVKPKGYIIWHDFANYGDYHDVTRAVLDTVPGCDVIQIAATQLALYRQPDQIKAS